jgi:hypothetical protein
VSPDRLSDREGLPTERDIRTLKDPAFTIPKSRPSGNFGVFLEDAFTEFRTRIRQFEQPLAAIMDTRSERVETLSQAILDAWHLGRADHMTEAVHRLGEGLSAVRVDLHSMSGRHSRGILEGQCWYRLAAWPGVTRRQDMFHTPFEISSRPCRFSPPDARALYLANSVYLCWKECGEPPLDQCFVARFEVEAPSDSYLDLACSHEAYLSPFSLLDLGLDPRTLSNGPYDRDAVAELAEYLTVWPILAAVSVKRANQSDRNPPEYLIPQLTMAWIRNNDDFLGVRYFTTKWEPNMGSQDWEINLALPTRSVRSHGFCEFLQAHTRCTVPVPLAALSDIPFAALASREAVEQREQRLGRVMLQRPGELSRYCDTEFGKMEYLLDRPSATLAPID